MDAREAVRTVQLRRYIACARFWVGTVNYTDVFGCAPCATRPHAHVFLRRNRSDTSNPRARVFGLRTCERASQGARFCRRFRDSHPIRVRTFLVSHRAKSLFPCAHVFVFDPCERAPNSFIRVRAFLHRNSSQRPVLGTRKRPLHAFHLEVVRPWGALRCSVYRLTLTRRLLPGWHRRCLGRGWR